MEPTAEYQTFKLYTGTKTIKAMPMGANEAQRHGARLTDETVKQNIGNYGYLVEYPDGYRSWSPKAVFEKAYKLSETHIDRMKIELADLNERICKATKAVFTPGLLGHMQRSQLQQQLHAMRGYAECLYDRIAMETEPRVIADNNAHCSTPLRKEADHVTMD